MNGSQIHKAGLSNAIDYWLNSDKGSFKILTVSGHTVVAFNDRGQDGHRPAETPLDVGSANLGVRMLLAGDCDLTNLMFESGIFYSASNGQCCISNTSLKRVFGNITYVLMTPWPTAFAGSPMPVCTCRVFGMQQTCQHVLVAQARDLPMNVIRRSFAETAISRKRGRPKGSAEPSAMRFHT